MPDLNHATIRRRHRGNAQPGESGYAHRQRSNKRRNNQNEASHPFHLPSRDRDEAQVPYRWICSVVPKLNHLPESATWREGKNRHGKYREKLAKQIARI
jgi:hypothetical protein